MMAAPDIIGSSRSIVRLRSYIEKVARSKANVLITGETGTGKERVAESIHRASPRVHAPFVCINCAAVPDSLLESELFGYERGAFTGAESSYPGKLRLAEGRTVFFDEIGEMSPYAQAKLLRVLENRELFPLGATRVVSVDVRFIAATNQDLEPLISENRFRKDLYYRLNVARVSLPSLKERKEDIPALVSHYVGYFNRRDGCRVPGPSRELLECLVAYEWPGNIRELRNLVEAIFIDPPTRPILLADLPDSFQRIFSRYVATRPGGERERLVSTLHATDWNKSRAAAQLNWSRMTLYRKLNKYHIDTKRR